MIKVLHDHSYNLDAGFCPLNRVCNGRPDHFGPPYRTGKNSLSIAADSNQKKFYDRKKSNGGKLCDEKRRMLQDLFKNSIVAVYLCASLSEYQGCIGENTTSTLLLTFCIWP